MRDVFVRLLALAVFAAAVGSLSAAPAITTSSVTATASSVFFAPNTIAELTCDGSGLTGDIHNNDSSGNGMWLSANSGGGSSANNPAGIAGAAWLRYRLDQKYVLSEMWVWNHNQINLTNRGLRNVSIHYSIDGSNWTLLGYYTLAQAPGTASYAAGNVIDFGDVRAKEVLITASSTNGNYGSTYYGLSEVRFYGDVAPCFPADYPVQLVSVSPDTSMTQMLAAQSSGWIGSDVAHSIPLDNGKVLWLFGDTLIGNVSGGQREGGAAFINNSIGIQDTALAPPAGMQFYWGAGNTSFFPHQPGTPGNFYWPTNGIYLNGELFLFCYSVSSGLNLDRTTLIRVANPNDPPTAWIESYHDFGIGGNTLNFHSAIRVEPPHVYFLGSEQAGGSSHAVLARITIANLISGSLGSSLEYYSNPSSPTWSSTTSSLVRLFTPGNTETSIHYEPTWSRYFATTYDVVTPTIYITTAPALTGPWSEPACIYEVPEHDAVSFPIWSYAARPHPEFSSVPGELVISYATNTVGTLAPLFTPEGLQIYVPKVIRAKFALPQTGVSDWSLY